MINIISKRKIWLSISGALFVIFGLALILWGFKFGIDFTGGSLMEVRFLDSRPAVADVQNALADLNLGSLTIQPAGEKDMILRFQDTSEETHQEVFKKLNVLVGGDPLAKPHGQGFSVEGIDIEGLDIKVEGQGEGGLKVEELRFDSVGPSIGLELKRKSVYAITFVFLAILAYISFAFRKVSKPVASWKFGVAALVAMFHDVIITLGVFSVLGEFYGVEVNTSFVAAALTVIGYSVHDTIVVFDRIRENLPKSNLNFEGTVDISLNQTLGRSISTSVTVLLTLLAIIVFGGVSIRTFALALAIGIFIGTYSSIFVASPLLVVWEKFKK